MSLVVPFAQNPYSIAIKTGSYTIPAGYYARVNCLEAGDADFTIDAVTAIKAKAISGSGSFTSGTDTIYTAPTGYIAEITFAINKASGAQGSTCNIVLDSGTYDGNFGQTDSVVADPWGNAGFEAPRITLASGSILKAQYSGSTGDSWYWSYSGRLIPTANEQTEFWCPTGTALVGDRYSVELYTIIT